MILTLIKKDMLLKFKNPVGFLLLMALPLFFTFIMGIVFTSSSDQNAQLPAIKILLEDHDNSLLSNLLLGSFRNQEMSKMFNLTTVGLDSGRALMDKGEASALLIIPKGFQDSLVNQHSTVLTIVKNPSEAFLPKITEETVNILAEGTDKLFRLAAPQMALLKEASDNQEWPAPAQVAMFYVLSKDLIEQVKDYLFPPLIEVKESVIKKPDESPKSTGNLTLAYILSGVAAMSIFFVLETLGRDYIREKENKTLFRIISSPVGRKRFLLSKQLFLMSMGLIAFMLVWTIGVIAFGIRIAWQDLPGFFLISILLTSALTGIVAFLFAIAKSRSISAAINPPVIIFFSILGGGMVPLQALPTFMKKAAVISPLYWGVDGLQQIFINHVGFSQVFLHIIILLALTLLFNTLAFTLFMRKF